MCRVDVAADAHGIICDTCNVWYHAECLNMSEEEYRNNGESPIPWTCSRCQQIKANNLKWGKHIGEEDIKRVLRECYDHNLEKEHHALAKG